MGTVEPIRSMKDLKKVEKILERKFKDLLLFTIGTTCGLRISDIVALDVRDVKELKPQESVYRELAMIKVRACAQERQGVISVADIFRANIVDVAKESLIIEITGNQSKIDAFINLLDGYEILEIARTGIAGLTRGMDQVVYLDK